MAGSNTSEEESAVQNVSPEPELILEGGKVLNVYSGEILDWDVTVGGGRILYVGPPATYPSGGRTRINLAGKILVPGYIEPHCHPWNVYNPVTLGAEACRQGTTTLVCDDLLFFMLMGVDRFESLMEALSNIPVKLFWFIRLVPQTPMEDEEKLFSEENIKRLLRSPHVLSVGEITRWPELVRGNPKLLEMIRFARDLRKRVDGHTAGAKFENLTAIARTGVESCHESIRAEEVIERLRLGMHVMLRQSSLRQDLRTLLKGVLDLPYAARRFMLTTDSSTPAYQREYGMMDGLLAIALEEGVKPVEAYRMVTLNPATYFGVEDRIGGIAPGRDADILVLRDLHHPTPEIVISRGKIAAENGRLLEPFPTVNWSRFFGEAADFGWRVVPDLFDIPADGIGDGGSVTFPVMRLVNPAITRLEQADFPVKEGILDICARNGFNWVATLNREGRWIATGVLAGYADRVEGIASTFNTATEIVAIGRSPEAMAAAVNRVLEIGGGIAAVERGRVVYELPLPLGGVMSDRPMSELAALDSALQKFLAERGFPFHDPLYTFIFLPNDFLPEVRLNRLGLMRVNTGESIYPARRLR
jgi:adenine deaminase